MFINGLYIIPPQTGPESLRQPTDTSQTQFRHLTDTPNYGAILTNPWQLGEIKAANRNESNWMFINCLHIIPSQTVSRVTQTTHRQTPSETPSRHHKIWHILTKPGQLGEKEAANKNEYNLMFMDCLHINPPDNNPSHSHNP